MDSETRLIKLKFELSEKKKLQTELREKAKERDHNSAYQLRIFRAGLHKVKQEITQLNIQIDLIDQHARPDREK